MNSTEIPTDAMPQLPLTLRYPPDQRLGTYLGAPAGVIDQLRALATAPGGDWVYLVGPHGVGKTHLLLASCAAADAAGRRTVFLSLAMAAGRLREALEAVEGHDLIALDGLDAVAGHREDEIALFDAHNRARASGATLLYSAVKNPDALALTLPDLRSRLGQCTRIVLSPLSDDGRREVLRQRAQRRGLALEQPVVEWLLKRVGRDLTGLTGLLDRLDRASLAAKRRLTLPFLREVVGPQPRTSTSSLDDDRPE